MIHNIVSLKYKLNEIAKKKDISPQIVMQTYIFDRLLKRIAKSAYSDNFILKGGVLISVLVDITNRTTKDLDALLNNVDFNRTNIENVFSEILSIDGNDEIIFTLDKIIDIRNNDPYGGFRITVKYFRETLKGFLQLDISSGDPVIPKPKIIKYETLLDSEILAIKSYTIETVLAEKLHTIFTHGLGLTRMRDYYDVFLIKTMRGNDIDYTNLKTAITETAKYRGNSNVFDNYQGDLKLFCGDRKLLDEWKNFIAKNAYVENIEFTEVVYTVEQMLKMVYSI